MKFKYVGKQPQNLAQVGIVKPGETIEVRAELGAGLLRHAPEQFEYVPDPVAGHKEEAKSAEPADTPAPKAAKAEKAKPEAG